MNRFKVKYCDKCIQATNHQDDKCLKHSILKTSMNGQKIYEIQYGSDAYGTTTNDSDNDIRGIFLPSLKECLSNKEIKIIQKIDETGDYVYFPIQKFFKLASKSNPSVIEWLFVGSEHIKIIEPAGKMIRNARLLFLSQEIYHRFKGFALSKFSSITKLTGRTGEKRREKILKMGYDTKHAMNSVRLLQQGIELLTTANLSMPRPNWQELVDIKKGRWSYKEIANKIDQLLKEIDKAKELSRLPENPRYEDTDDLMIKIIMQFAEK